MQSDNKLLLLAFDLYWLRFKKEGEKWFELTDYLRDKLITDGCEISYTKDDVIFKRPSDEKVFSIKAIINKNE